MGIGRKHKRAQNFFDEFVLTCEDDDIDGEICDEIENIADDIIYDDETGSYYEGYFAGYEFCEKAGGNKNMIWTMEFHDNLYLFIGEEIDVFEKVRTMTAELTQALKDAEK